MTAFFVHKAPKMVGMKHSPKAKQDLVCVANVKDWNLNKNKNRTWSLWDKSLFLVGMTGFEPATSCSQNKIFMSNKQICSKINRIFRKFSRFRPMCPSVTTQKNSVNGQTCGQPDFAKKRKKIQLHPYFNSSYSNSQVIFLIRVIFKTSKESRRLFSSGFCHFNNKNFYHLNQRRSVRESQLIPSCRRWSCSLLNTRTTLTSSPKIL